MTNQTDPMIKNSLKSPTSDENNALNVCENRAEIRQSKRISPFWILPFLALCLGAVLFFQIIQEQGIPIKIIFDNGDGLVAGKTQIRYQGLQIGVVKKVNFSADLKHVEVESSIYPEAKKLLRDKTTFWIVRPSASLAGVSGIDTLVSGNYISLQPAGEKFATSFIGQPKGPITYLRDGDLLIHLIAKDLGSISVGASVYFKQIPVGKIYDYRLTEDNSKVEIDVVIEKPYANFVKKDSRFWNISGINADIGLSGIKFNAESLSAVVQGAVAFDSPQNSPPAEQQERYTLYHNFEYANANIVNDVIVPTLTLNAQQLSGISEQSVVLYHQYEVGKVSAVRPTEKNFEVDVYIYPKYRHLITDNSLFWQEAAMKLNVGLQGVDLQISPLGRVLKGAIAFDNTSRKAGDNTLYSNEHYAKSQGNEIIFNAESAVNLTENMSLRYKGLNVGKVDRITLKTDCKDYCITVHALISPKYISLVARKGNVFRVITPQIATSGVENLDALLGSYIDIEVVGKGKQQKIFSLVQQSDNRLQYRQGFPLVLETSDAMNITAGSPVIYRGIEVGIIDRLMLNELGDRVQVHILIEHKYKHLVRQNSQFWIASGYGVDVGLSGVSINTGSIRQLLKGGIAFSTPSSTVLAPAAQANQHFLLQINRPLQAESWNTGVLPH